MRVQDERHIPVLIFAEIMEQRDRSEDMLQESFMTTGEPKEVLFCQPCGSGLPPTNPFRHSVCQESLD
jgi:hypothetical protein